MNEKRKVDDLKTELNIKNVTKIEIELQFCPILFG
jgi:hypothetical protein